MKETARTYFDLGNNIVVLNGKKEPLVKWMKWQQQRQTLEEFENLPWTCANLFGIVCGLKLKNGLYVGAIDIDVKKVSEEALERGKQFEKLLKVATQTEETPSHGKHYIYYSRKPIKTDNKAHGFAGVEVLGTRKLCILSSSKGYRRLNDNAPRIVESLNQLVDSALSRIGFKGPQHRRRGVNLNQDIDVPMSQRKIRPCINEALKREHLKHDAKLAVIIEYQHAGTSADKIEALFHEHRGFEPIDYSPEKTRYQVQFTLEKKYPNKFSCVSLDELGLCVGNACSIFRRRRRQFEKKVEML